MSENYSEDIAKELADKLSGTIRQLTTKRKREKLATAKNNRMWNKVLRRREKENKQNGITLTQEQYDTLCQHARPGVTAESKIKELEDKVAGLEKTNGQLSPSKTAQNPSYTPQTPVICPIKY